MVELTNEYVKLCGLSLVTRRPPHTRRRCSNRNWNLFDEDVNKAMSKIRFSLQAELLQFLKFVRRQVSSGKTLFDCQGHTNVCDNLIERVTMLPFQNIQKKWLDSHMEEIKNVFISSIKDRFGTADSETDSDFELMSCAACFSPLDVLQAENPRKSENQILKLAEAYGNEKTAEYTGKSGRYYKTTSLPVIHKEKCIRQWPLLRSEISRLAAICKETPALIDLYKPLETPSLRFPDCFQLLQIVLTWLTGTASIERSFSAMKRIKTRLRSSMCGVDLECHLMWKHNKYEATDELVNKIVNLWYNAKPRNISL